MIGKFSKGFTVIELLMVLVVIALLVSIAVPVVGNSITRAKESVLKENLLVIRKAIDDYYTDTGRYPENLAILSENRYLRKIPDDSITSDDGEWHLIFSEQYIDGRRYSGVIDIRSQSTGVAMDGTKYTNW